MKLKLTNSEYDFFCSILENFSREDKPASITDLATTAIMLQIRDRLPRRKPAHLRPAYSFGLKDYEAIYIFKLANRLKTAYAPANFEFNVLRKIVDEIHQKLISQYM